jgi:cytochrome c oxidase subunit 2
MADSPRYPGTGVGIDRSSKRGMPRSVKVCLIIVLVLVVAFVFLQLTGLGGEHGPGRHGDSSSVAADAVEIAVAADNFAFDPNEITVTAGDAVAIVLTSVDTLHDFAVDELDAHVAAEWGETATGGFHADRPAGTRSTAWCPGTGRPAWKAPSSSQMTKHPQEGGDE